MKKIIAWLLVLAMTAAISIGATLAYLTDTDEDVNVMTVGNVKIDQLEYERVDDETANEEAAVQEFHDNKPLYPAVTDKDFDYANPGDTYVDWEQIGKDGYTTEIWNPETINNELDKMVFVKNKGTYDAYVRTVFAFEAGNYETLDQFLSMVHLNLNEEAWTWTWVETPVAIANEENGENTTKYFVAVATHNEILEPGQLTEISLSQIALDKSATNADVEAFGDTYQILVKSQGIQADGFTNAAEALDEGFSPIDALNIPWETDAPTAGATMLNALYYLDGDVTTDAITTKVSSVTYGLTKDYAAIANKYDGTLMDVEQDVPAYAYYVPNGSNYDIYILSDDVIYAPADSTALFKGMTSLTSVDSANLDVSRVQSMKQLFRECANLKNVDLTDWDTSNVTNIGQMFYKCTSLEQIPGIEDLDLSSCVTANAVFRNCTKLQNLDLSNWDMSNVTTLAQIFMACNSMTELKVNGWDTGKCTDMSYMFYNNPKLQRVEAAGWDTSEATTLYAAFAVCPELVSVDTTGWTNSKVTNGYGIFLNDYKLTEVIGTESWNFASLEDGSWMFQNTDIKALNVSNWDLSNLKLMNGMFMYCEELETLTGTENWRLTSVQDMYAVFYYNFKLQELNTADWGLGNCTSMSNTFHGCRQLVSVDVSKWDVSKVTTFQSAFSGAGSNVGDMHLKSFDASNWDTSSLETVKWMFYGCGQLTDVDISGWNVEKLRDTGHMFADCFKLENVNFSGWGNTKNLFSMDAMYNDCHALKTVDMSMFDTSNVVEFSQMFEACWSLEQVIGMENWETSKGCTFVEMFNGCGSLKVLNWDKFDTGSAYDKYYDSNNSYSNAFNPIFGSVNKLEKLVVSDKISYYGNGTVPEGNKLVFPNPAAKEGYTAKWRNVETGQLYLGKDIPEKTAATYEAYYEPIATN